MALPDRAQSILPILADEPDLQFGEITFVVHSLGGLVVKQILRLAESRAPHDHNVSSFMKRVRRIIFIGTPHAGSDLASFGNAISLVTRPRPTQAGLSRNDPYLRDLNAWFRSYADTTQLAALVLHESKQMPLISIPILGIPLIRWQIVKPDSADPGLSPATRIIPLDEDHLSIVSPVNRDSLVYKHVSSFIRVPVVSLQPKVRSERALDNIEAKLENQTAKLDTISSEMKSNALSLGDVIEKFSETQSSALRDLERSVVGQNNQVVSDELERRLNLVRKLRLFSNFDIEAECTRLFTEALTGDLSTAFAQHRRKTFAWCARMMAKKDLIEANRMLDAANRIGTGAENRIAAAIISAAKNGNHFEALAMLQPLDTPEACTAALAAVAINAPPPVALSWLEQTNLTVESFDADGKLLCISQRLETGQFHKALEELDAVGPEDFATAPLLYMTASAVYLAQVTHPDLRAAIATNPPINARDFPLSGDPVSLKHRRRARDLYRAANAALSEIGQPNFAAVAADYALWLELRDPETEKSALINLKLSMADRLTSLRRLPMALDYNLKLNLEAIEREVDSETALTGGSSFEAAIARFALAHTKRSPQEVAAYIERHRQQLVRYIDPDMIVLIQAEMLVRAGDVSTAKEKIASIASSTVQSDAILRIERLCAEAEGADLIFEREKQYEQTKSLADLYILVVALKEKEAWDKLYNYSHVLFAQTKDTLHAELYVSAMYALSKDKELIDFIELNLSVLDQSIQIKTFYAWSQYRYGNLGIAKKILDQLMATRDIANDRILFVNLMTASGNWSALVTFIESEWTRRANRTAKELLTAGQLAHRVGLTPRARELITEAAEKADDDAVVLLACYSAATAAGWENESNSYRWFQRAAAISGPDGPIKTMNMRDLLNMQPDWNDRQSKTSEELISAQIPMYLAAAVLNQTLLQIFLISALSNSLQPDVRKRSMLPAYAGNRTVQKNNVRKIALDPTVLLTLAFLGILQETIESFEVVIIPHTTLGWLFQESQQIEYHQPSRLRDALNVKRLIDTGHLMRFERITHADVRLETEVGDELASLLTSAKSGAGEINKKIYVVRPYPISKVGTFMDEVADVTGFEDTLVGCRDVVRALRVLGQITAAEEAHYEAYLTLHEKPWPHNPDLSAKATLYLDRVAVSYFQHLGLLGKLKDAGFEVFVPASEIEEGDALVRHAAVGDDAKRIIEIIRSTLAAGIEFGNVRLSPLTEKTEINLDKIAMHPSTFLFFSAGHVDGFVVDDRCLNKFTQINTDFGTKPVYTSLDLLAQSFQSGRISEDTQIELVTKLRRAGFVLIPQSAEELSKLLLSANVADNKIIETAELRSIREAVLRIRMTDVLQIPEEYTWLQNSHTAFIDAMSHIWSQQGDVATASARSDWLFALLDVRSWGHRIAVNGADLLAIRRIQLMRLILLPNLTTNRRKLYWDWLEKNVLEPLQHSEPMEYNQIVQNVKSFIQDSVNRLDLEEASNDK